MQKPLSWSELLFFCAVIFAIRTQLEKIQKKKYSLLCVKILWKNILIRTEGSSQCCQILKKGQNLHNMFYKYS